MPGFTPKIVPRALTHPSSSISSADPPILTPQLVPRLFFSLIPVRRLLVFIGGSTIIITSSDPVKSQHDVLVEVREEDEAVLEPLLSI